MSTLYNNPRVEKYFPISGREDFFKFAVMNGNEIATGYDNKELIFQDEKEAQRIVKARIKCNIMNAKFLASKPKKYKYYKVIQSYVYGWNDLVQHECNSEFNVIDNEDFKGDLKCYRENSKELIRVIKRKELNPDYKADN